MKTVGKTLAGRGLFCVMSVLRVCGAAAATEAGDEEKPAVTVIYEERRGYDSVEQALREARQRQAAAGATAPAVAEAPPPLLGGAISGSNETQLIQLLRLLVGQASTLSDAEAMLSESSPQNSTTPAPPKSDAADPWPEPSYQWRGLQEKR